MNVQITQGELGFFLIIIFISTFFRGGNKGVEWTWKKALWVRVLAGMPVDLSPIPVI